MLKYLLVLSLFTISSLVFAESDNELPDDVASFIEKRDGCDHFRGEEPYDEARRSFLVKNINELCTGTDKELSDLKSKYKESAEIQEKLSGYEEDIEPNE
jgi:hypothetical protein